MTDITDRTSGIGEAWERGVAGPLAEFLTTFARGVAARPDSYSDDLVNSARAVLATVEAPAPSLAEELRHIAEHWEEWDTDTITVALAAATDRAKQTEYDLAEASAEVERLTAERDRLVTEAGIAREAYDVQTEALKKAHQDHADTLDLDRSHTAEREVIDTINDHYNNYAVQKGAESNAETPDPADVPPGEAWIVEVDGERRNAVKDSYPRFPWNTVGANNRFYDKGNEDVTLITRLVPAPRVITNTDELEALPHRTVIRDSADVMFQRIIHGWYQAGDTSVHRSDDNFVCLPVTVLWEPEV